MHNHGDFEKEVLPYIGKAGWLMTGLASIISFCFGWSTGVGLAEKIPYAVGLGAASFLLAWMITATVRALQVKSYGIAAVAGIAALLTGFVEYGSHFGYSAANRVHSIQNASLQTTGYKDIRSDVDSARKDVDRIQGRLAWMDTAVNGKPVRTADAAQSDIDKAKAHRWWGVTDNCNATKGPQTREFCATYRSAEAEKSLAIEKGTLEEELKAAKSKYDEVRKAASETTPGLSSAEAQVDALTSLATMSLTPTADAKTWGNYGVSMTLSLWFLVIGSACFVVFYGFARKDDDVPEAPSFRAAVSGEPTIVQIREENRDALELIAKLKRLLPPPAQLAA